MGSAEFPDFESYDVGRVWPDRPNVVRRMLGSLTAARCTGAAQVDYRKVSVGFESTKSWNRLVGYGAEAPSGPRRSWDHAACMAFPNAMIDGVKRVYDGKILDGVARVTMAGDVVAGPFSEGVTFGRFDPYAQVPDAASHEIQRTLLYRVGATGVEIAMPALILPDWGTMLIPEKVDVLDPAVNLGQSLWQATTGTPVA